MQCPRCKSKKIVKNGRRKDKQNYLCRDCNRQFRDVYDQRGYSPEVKEHCLTLYCNGMGAKLSLPSRRETTICADALRGIERSTGVCHNTVINWVKEVSSQIPDENYEIPETAQLDELQTFVGSKSGATPMIFNHPGNAHQDKTKFGCGAGANAPSALLRKVRCVSIA